MQYPGTSPFGGGSGFGGAGANALTNQLSPNSLQQRRQQLIHAMVTGSDQRRRPVGAGVGGALGATMGISPFLASLFGRGNDDGGQFYGAGAPTPAAPSPAAPSPAAPATSAVDPSQSAPAAATDPVTALSGATGGYDPYQGGGGLAAIIAALSAAVSGANPSSGSGYRPGVSSF